MLIRKNTLTLPMESGGGLWGAGMCLGDWDAFWGTRDGVSGAGMGFEGLGWLLGDQGWASGDLGLVLGSWELVSEDQDGFGEAGMCFGGTRDVFWGNGAGFQGIPPHWLQSRTQGSSCSSEQRQQQKVSSWRCRNQQCCWGPG